MRSTSGQGHNQETKLDNEAKGTWSKLGLKIEQTTKQSK